MIGTKTKKPSLIEYKCAGKGGGSWSGVAKRTQSRHAETGDSGGGMQERGEQAKDIPMQCVTF